VTDAGEASDDGNDSDSDACSSTCEEAFCGDALVFIGEEECDDGNQSNTDSCLDDCAAARCGDGVEWVAVEECDDGMAVDDDGCDADCVQSEAVSLALGGAHTCARLRTGNVRCWGSSDQGQLGHGNTESIGDEVGETPVSAGTVEFGGGRASAAISAGAQHTCAVLDTGAVRCWGEGTRGQLGYGNTESIGDDEAPGSAGTVDIGAGRTAVAISAGGYHTCAVLDTGAVRCWGHGGQGRLGYSNQDNIGDDEAPGSVGTVNLGAGRTAVAVAAGTWHTCAILDGGAVRCWGSGSWGQLGYGNTNDVGDDETPGSVGTVDIGPGRTATALAAGAYHTCAILDTGAVLCWGLGTTGRLGYGNTNTIGDDEFPSTAGDVEVF
jgi:cysteine-rich repeat protein